MLVAYLLQFMDKIAFGNAAIMGIRTDLVSAIESQENGHGTESLDRNLLVYNTRGPPASFTSAILLPHILDL